MSVVAGRLAQIEVVKRVPPSSLGCAKMRGDKVLDPLETEDAMKSSEGAWQQRASQTKLDASILSYDGQDFVRTETTLMNEGKSAVGTKLDRDSAAYKALVEKRSYTGPHTVFGRDYQANFAPLVGEDGKITGALFVGVPK